jgi:hypothetical protein
MSGPAFRASPEEEEVSEEAFVASVYPPPH